MDFLYFLLLQSKHFALPARVIKRYGNQVGLFKMAINFSICT